MERPRDDTVQGTSKAVPKVAEQIAELVGMSVKHLTKTKQVETIAAAYLIQKGRRATSGEMLPVLLAKGITVPGKVPSKTVSSYMSTSKLFDNVPAYGGYGLVEWNGRRTAPSSTPAGALNEVIHDGGKLPLNS